MANKKSSKTEENIHKKHRERMKKQLLSGAFGDSTPSHVLLEMLLYFSIPRIDTNELAHSLLDRFGSIEGVIEAKKEELMAVKGIGDNTAALCTLLSLLRRRTELEELDKVNCFSVEKAKEFLFAKLKDCPTEKVTLLCLDKAGKFVSYSDIGEGDLSSVNFDMRKILQFATNEKTASVFICHNHPSGKPEPSRIDCEVTNNIKTTLENIGVCLVDHIVVAKDGYYSMATKSTTRVLRREI